MAHTRGHFELTMTELQGKPRKLPTVLQHQYLNLFGYRHRYLYKVQVDQLGARLYRSMAWLRTIRFSPIATFLHHQKV
jgi:hypothetical protein